MTDAFRLLMIALVLAPVSACDASTPPSDPVSNGASASDGAYVLPIDAYGFDVAQRSMLSRARTILIGTCMKRLGFTFDAAAAAAQEEAGASADRLDLGAGGNGRRYGITDDATAERFGYHLPSAASKNAKTNDENPHGLGSMTPQKRAALTGGGDLGTSGVPSGGCLGWAKTQLWGPRGETGTPVLVAKIMREGFDKSFTDPAVSKAVSDWSRCMADKGYDYPTPRDAGADVYAEGPTPSAREVAAARSDVRCKKDSRLVEVWHGFEVSYQTAQIQEHFEELKAIREENAALLKRAADTVATTGG